MKTSRLIFLRRTALGLTMRQLADAVGVSEGTISRWESGDIKNMRREKIDLLAKALQISPNELIHEDKIKIDTPPREIEEAIITCPVCGYDNSHYIRTVGVDFKNEKSSGFAIEFLCEDNHTFYWIIESYKGNTYAIVTDGQNDIDILKRYRLEDDVVSLADIWDSEDETNSVYKLLPKDSIKLTKIPGSDYTTSTKHMFESLDGIVLQKSDAQKLIEDYHSLNEEGRKLILDLIDGMVESEKYKSPSHNKTSRKRPYKV